MMTGNSILDHVVGLKEKSLWEFDAERLGRLEVEHEVELRGPLDRQVTRFFAFENPIYVHQATTKQVIDIGPVTH
jgi:hypothetical protein